jgi:beta-lactamase class A
MNPRYAQQRRRHQLMLLGGLGVVGLVAAWAIWWQSTRPPEWLTLPAHWATFVSVSELAKDPDPMTLTQLPESQEDVALKELLTPLVESYNFKLKTHLYYMNLKTGAFLSLNGDEPVPAASVIKVPILLEYFRTVGEGKLALNQQLLYDFIHQAGGSGELQYQTPGKLLESKTLATSMIQTSDNSATNIFIDHLGGMAALNQKFRRMGLSNTSLSNWLPDLEGTNKISTKDMATILYNVAYTNYLGPEGKQVALEILKGTHNRRLIPAGLPADTPVAHKTGDIGTSLGDSALVMLPDGNAYLLSIQVERPYNDYSAKELIVELSRQVFQHHQMTASLATAASGPPAASGTASTH